MNEYSSKSEGNPEKYSAIKSSEDFDKEMEEFFTMREAERSSGENTYKIEKKWDAKESAMASGCCMTGCHNCPWGYKLPSEDQ